MAKSKAAKKKVASPQAHSESATESDLEDQEEDEEPMTGQPLFNSTRASSQPSTSKGPLTKKNAATKKKTVQESDEGGSEQTRVQKPVSQARKAPVGPKAKAAVGTNNDEDAEESGSEPEAAEAATVQKAASQAQPRKQPAAKKVAQPPVAQGESSDEEESEEEEEEAAAPNGQRPAVKPTAVKQKRKRMADRAGLAFPVSRVLNNLKDGEYAKTIQKSELKFSLLT